MRNWLPVMACVLLPVSALADEAASAANPAAAAPIHRYLIERTFPAGALDGLDAATKEKVNYTNTSVGVRWIQSFANEGKTKTYCVYEGPSEDAVRKAAALNGLPIDRVTEVPVTLWP